MIRADIRDERTVLPLFSECQTIVHLAAVSSLAACQLDPQEAFSVNLAGTALISKIANSSGASIIFASTSAVYENSNRTPFVESLVPDQTLIYPLTKRFAELTIEGLSRSNGLSFVNLRFFNVFGPRQDVKRTNPPLINYLLREHMLGRIPKLYAPQHQRRDYVCASDVLNLIGTLLKSRKPLPNTDMNVCSGIGISLEEIRVSLEFGLGENISFEQGKPSELWENYSALFDQRNSLSPNIVEKETLKNSIGDPSKALEVFGWSAQRNVLDAIPEEITEMKLHIKKSLGLK